MSAYHTVTQSARIARILGRLVRAREYTYLISDLARMIERVQLEAVWHSERRTRVSTQPPSPSRDAAYTLSEDHLLDICIVNQEF